MSPFPSIDGPPDAGFITPVFAALALGLGLVAGAYVLSARTELDAAERASARQVALLLLEGLSNRTAWTLLGEAGTPTLQWTEPSAVGSIVVAAEPEALKLSPLEAGRPNNIRLFSDLLSSKEGEVIATKLSGSLSAKAPDIERGDVVAASSEPLWRRCANSIVSPYSRLTAFALPAPRAPAADGPADFRPGQMWRLSMVSQRGWWLDRVVRFTGDPQRPIAVVEQDFGFDRGRFTQDCLAQLAKIGALHG